MEASGYPFNGEVGETKTLRIPNLEQLSESLKKHLEKFKGMDLDDRYTRVWNSDYEPFVQDVEKLFLCLAERTAITVWLGWAVDGKESIEVDELMPRDKHLEALLKNNRGLRSRGLKVISPRGQDSHLIYTENPEQLDKDLITAVRRQFVDELQTNGVNIEEIMSTLDKLDVKRKKNHILPERMDDVITPPFDFGLISTRGKGVKAIFGLLSAGASGASVLHGNVVLGALDTYISLHSAVHNGADCLVPPMLPEGSIEIIANIGRILYTEEVNQAHQIHI